MSHALERIRKVARERKKEKFISLFHHISVELLEEAFYELNADAAPGVDRLTWKDYEGEPRAQSRRFARPGPCKCLLLARCGGVGMSAILWLMGGKQT